MDQIIISLSGRKGAGKNTVCSFIRQYFPKTKIAESIQAYMPESLECSFADDLKEFCINTLGLEYKQCYGSDDDKNTKTKYLWENVSPFIAWSFGTDPILKTMKNYTSEQKREYYYRTLYIDGRKALTGHKTGYMTGRDIMQLFGTDLVRDVFGNVWADATIRRIRRMNKPLSIITDNRFPSEVYTVLKEPKSYIIRLTRSPSGTSDLHPSETALDQFDWHRPNCFVLDNQHLSIEEQSQRIIPILKSIFGD